MVKSNGKPSTQHTVFKKAARELGCDESEAGLDKALRKIGKAAPEPKPSKPKHKPIKLAI